MAGPCRRDDVLNRPEGIDGAGWRIVAGEPYEYALWRSDDDAYALEVVTPDRSQARRTAEDSPKPTSVRFTAGRSDRSSKTCCNDERQLSSG